MESGPRKSVFLSSTFKEDFGDGLADLGLRKRLLEVRETLPVSLWTYEHVWGGSISELPPDADTIIDRCFAGIKACDLFVFILTGRHGSGAAFVEDRITASYLELELFAAAVLRKPILVLHYAGREPEPALHDTISILRRAFEPSAYVVDDEKALFVRFQDTCRELARGSTGGSGHAAAVLPEGLSRRRTRDDMEADLTDPRLLFLDGEMRSRNGKLNARKAEALIHQVAAGERGNAAARRVLPHGASLFRLWAAMRELMDEHGRAMHDPTLAPLLDRALGLWATKASWFGLHGTYGWGRLLPSTRRSTCVAALPMNPPSARPKTCASPWGQERVPSIRLPSGCILAGASSVIIAKL